MKVPGDFDAAALFAVVDQQLAERNMTVAKLNRELAWMSQKTFDGLRQQSDPGCQHILPIIQWVGRTPRASLWEATRLAANSSPNQAKAGGAGTGI